MAGCGNGAVTNRLVNRWDVLGCDLSAAAMQHVLAPTLVVDLAAIPLADHAFDLVLASDVVEHLPDSIYHLALSELARVARKYVLVAVPYEELLCAAEVTCPECNHHYHAHLHQRSYGISDVLNLLGPEFGVRAIHLSGERWGYSDPSLVHARQVITGLDYPFEDAVCPVCGTRRGVVHQTLDTLLVARRFDAMQAMLSAWGALPMPNRSEVLVLFERGIRTEVSHVDVGHTTQLPCLLDVASLEQVPNPINYPEFPLRVDAHGGELILALPKIPRRIKIMQGKIEVIEIYDYVRQCYVHGTPDGSDEFLLPCVPFGPNGCLVRIMGSSPGLVLDIDYVEVSARDEMVALCFGDDPLAATRVERLADAIQLSNQLEAKRENLERLLQARDRALTDASQRFDELTLAVKASEISMGITSTETMNRSTPKSVLVLSHMYPRDYHPAGGIFVHEQVKALRAAGVDARVLSGEPYWINTLNPIKILKSLRNWRNHEFPAWELVDGVPLIRFPYIVSSRFLPFQTHAFTYTSGVTRCLSRLMKAFEFQLVHAHTAYTDGSAGVAIAAQHGVPLVITEHTGPFKTLTRTSYLKRKTEAAINAADCLITVSQALMGDITDQIAMKRHDRAIVLPNVVDTHAFVAAPRENDGRIRALWVGHFVSVKRVEVLLRAMAMAVEAEPRLCLRLVGAGALKGDLQQLAHKLGIESYVEFAGHVERISLPAHYQESDFLVISSESETFGVVAIEAMSCGRPVLTTDCGGPTEIVTHESLGMVVHKSAESIAQGLQAMALRTSNKDFSAELIRKVAQNRYSLAAVASKLIKTYAKLIAA